MRIAIFTNNYLPNPYGVATSVETFRREFEKLGHEIFIFAPEFPGYADRDKNIFRYPSVDIEIKFRFPLPLTHSWKMYWILRKMDFDVIHAQHPNLLGWAAARWAKKKKIPLVFTWHTLYDRYAHFAKIVPEKMAATYAVKQAVKYANRADAVVVPTDSIIPVLKGWGVSNRNIFPVATGVAGEDFLEADGEVVRKKYNIAKDEVILLSTHRLTQEKNMEFLFRSILPVLKEGKAKFLVVGDGDLRPQLEKFYEDNGVSDRVFFCGIIPRHEIKNYYAAADIFVHASSSETQGMVLSEAMYVGLPVVAVDATGAKSLVLNNGNGFLVSEDDREFRDAILRLVEDRNLRHEFGVSSGRIAKMKFTSDVCAKELLKVYEKVIVDKKVQN